MTLKVFDDHIENVDRVSLLHSEDYQSIQQGDYRFWKMSEFDTPNNTIEQALHEIWKDIINPIDYKEGGIEYWVTKSKGDASAVWHVDTPGPGYGIDNMSHFSMEIPPAHTIVYYPWVENLQGGFLEIICNEQYPTTDQMFETLKKLDPNTIERFQPITNRAILFDSHRIHRIAKMYSGSREMIASTIWTKIPQWRF